MCNEATRCLLVLYAAVCANAAQTTFFHLLDCTGSATGSKNNGLSLPKEAHSWLHISEGSTNGRSSSSHNPQRVGRNEQAELSLEAMTLGASF